MALIKDPNEQDQASGQLGSQAVGTISGGTAGNPAASAAAPQAKGSGSFVNLGRYMNANQGNEAVGNSVNDIDKTGQAAQDSFKGAQDNFNGIKVNAPNTLSSGDQTFLDKKSAANSLSNYASLNSSSYGGESAGTALPRIGDNIEKLKYNGPSTGEVATSAANYSKTYGDLNNTAKTFEASPDGVALRRQSLVDANSQRAGGNYGAGAGNLDSLLTEKQGQPTFDARRAALGSMAGTYKPDAVSARTADLTGQVNSAQAASTANYGAATSQYDKIKDAWAKKSAQHGVVASTPQQSFGTQGLGTVKAQPTYAPLPTPAPPTYSVPTNTKTDEKRK